MPHGMNHLAAELRGIKTQVKPASYRLPYAASCGELDPKRLTHIPSHPKSGKNFVPSPSSPTLTLPRHILKRPHELARVPGRFFSKHIDTWITHDTLTHVVLPHYDRTHVPARKQTTADRRQHRHLPATGRERLGPREAALASQHRLELRPRR